ncbi:MAG TPA: cupredoxin domain-containing protein [Candidatus Limnocylindria bacterium]|nr:cupredoxin domain-containing protein [Candidatus Limnocylindria bacterium]
MSVVPRAVSIVPRVAGAVMAASLLAGCAGPAPPSRPPVTPVTIRSASGETLAYAPALVTVVAPGAVLVTFRNESALAHNLVFREPLSGATRTIVDPGTSDQVTLDPVEPGSHPFICTIHDGMAGVLVVERPLTTSARAPRSGSPAREST